MSDLMTISEVAQILGVSDDTVIRRFAKVKGVIDLGSPETPKRRRYRVLRIPKSVVEKFLLTRGGPVEIKAPVRPSKQTVSAPPNEDEIIRQLAALSSQHGTAAQKTMNRIVERARLLRFVPKDQWEDVCWIDDDGDL
jgi:hypothetical protein